MTSKEQYRQLCEQESLPLFLQAWWLEAVTQPDNKQWDVLLALDKHDNICGAMPYLHGKKYGLRYITQPQLTQYTGLWIRPDITDLSQQKHIQNNIIAQVEQLKPHFFSLNFLPQYTNWLPFYWSGFSQTTRYSYHIEDISNPQQVFQQFDYAKQKQIKKATDNIIIDYDMTADQFYDLQCKQLQTVGNSHLCSRQLVTTLINTARSRGQGMIVRAKDAEGNTHAAIFVVWDEHCAYDLMSAIHPQYRSSGASTLIVWDAIQQLSTRTKAWDFEGSMIEGVENSFRQFGAKQLPYFTITKYNRLIQILKAVCNK